MPQGGLRDIRESRTFKCPVCSQGNGWFETGNWIAAAPSFIGDGMYDTYDVALREYIRCPARCDGGFYITSKQIGARPDDQSEQRIQAA